MKEKKKKQRGEERKKGEVTCMVVCLWRNLLSQTFVPYFPQKASP